MEGRGASRHDSSTSSTAPSAAASAAIFNNDGNAATATAMPSGGSSIVASLVASSSLVPAPPPSGANSSTASSSAVTSSSPLPPAMAGVSNTTASSSLMPSGSSSMNSASTSSSTSRGISHRPAVFDKLEQLVKDMQDQDHGVPVRSQKIFITTIPAAFMGYDLIEWLMDRLSIEDSLEAVHLANLLCQFGYYFPIQELKNLIVKDDSSLYRFQTPYYWPSQHHTPDNVEYAIYLAKRSQRKNQKHSLEDYEVEAYNNLRKILASKWDFVTMQAEEQLKLNKDRKKGDKIVTDSQEKAYWRVYRPPPGFTTVVESSPVPTREQRLKARSRTREHLTEEVEFLKNYMLMARAKVSQVAENIIEYTEDYFEFDAVLNPNSVAPSNPWITDDQTYWLLNQPSVDCPTEKRVRKWSISLENLISDQQGVTEFMGYLKKEYSHENLRFWLAVQELRTGPGIESKIRRKVKEIWDEFLSPGAKSEINIDGKTMEATKTAMKVPSRYTYEVAAEHVYTLLLKKDCYPRFIRSDHYKALAANSVNPGNQKKRFPFPFAVKSKKPSTAQNPTCSLPVTNLKADPGDSCAIYGADRSELPSGEPPALNSATRVLSCDQDDNVCPWEVGDDQAHSAQPDPAAPAPAPAPVAQPLAAVPLSSSSSSVAPARRHTHSSSGQKETASASKDRDGAAHGALTREPSRSSRRGAGEGHHHRHHDHHHHHEHHHSASKRAKSKSKRKKSSRGRSGNSTSTTAAVSTAATGPDKENISSTAEMLAAGTMAVMSTAATTAGVAASSAAAAAAVATVSAGPDREENSNSKDATHPASSSKCTQTKLEATTMPPLQAPQVATTPIAPTTTSSSAAGTASGDPGDGKERSRESKMREWRSMELVARGEAGELGGGSVPRASSSESPGPSGSSKRPDNQRCAAGNSTEVCPWEDEDNTKDSHAPFVKTYATLGYL